MANSDERREAAGQMRKEAADFRSLGEKYNHVWFIDLCDVPAVFQGITHFAGLDGAVREDELFDRMADLMDPTCEVESVERVGEGEFDQTIGYAFHLTCGHCVMRPYTDMPPCYCDECGRRVIVGGEG